MGTGLTLNPIQGGERVGAAATIKDARGYMLLWSGRNGYQFGMIDCDDPGATPHWTEKYRRVVKI
jgi:hypothetical protein